MSRMLAARISEALGHIPATDRDLWLRMGMSIKSSCGDDGFPLWDSWSQNAENYDRKAALHVWRSIKPEGKTTVASLFFEAQRMGWKDRAVIQCSATSGPKMPILTATASRLGCKAEAEKTARLASLIWEAASAALKDNPYLVRKRLLPQSTIREIDAERAAGLIGYTPKCNGVPLLGRLLVVPLSGERGLQTIELIDASGKKAALKGHGSKAGAWWATHAINDSSCTENMLLVGEGMATVLTAALATSRIGIAAFSNANILAVAKAMRIRFPSAEIIILADLEKTSRMPDRFAVRAAARCAAKLAIPTFSLDCRPDQKDFNDMAVANGHAAVANCIALAQTIAPAVAPVAATKDRSLVEFACAKDLAPQSIKWLWPGYIAKGKLSVLAGAPGTGKTTIATSLAATVTSAGSWPDGSQSPVGEVVVWSGEDGHEDTLVPKLIASSADLSRIRFIKGILQAGEKREFDPARDVEALRNAITNNSVSLLIIDPLVSAVAGDSHKNAEVRRSLQPLVDLAAERNCALLGITHFSKGTSGRDPLERVTGSLAFGALARCVLVTARGDEIEGGQAQSRILVRAKSNISEDGGGFEYDLPAKEIDATSGIVATRVEWGRPIVGTARTLITALETGPEPEGRGRALDEAKSFLSDLLANGALPTCEIEREAKASGIAWATVKRAKTALGLQVHKEGMKGGWSWSLDRSCSNGAEDAQQSELSIFDANEQLRARAAKPEPKEEV